MAFVTRVLALAGALALVLHLAQSVIAAAMFIAYLLLFLVPAVVAVARTPQIRDLPPDLRITASAVLVVLASVPWYFARKALGMPLVTDVIACAVLTTLALRGRERPQFRLSPLAAGVGAAFALVWLGYAARTGNSVRFYGLFAVDFGNLVSIVSSLRVSPILPLGHVVDSGPLHYHWLYFTLPATLADFLGLSMPNANALILTNLVMALLLVHTVTALARALWPAAVVLFAPFSVYAYQLAASRLELGWLEIPARNHLLLSPLNSMITFGNNTFALVLVLFTMAMLERWNSEGKIGDAILGVAALAAIIGYSVTLIFPLAGALIVWTLLGRVRRPWIIVPLAALTGAAAILVFRSIHVLGTDPTRRIAFAFDNGAFLRMVALGMLPLWVLLVVRGRQALTFQHVVIGAALIVPSVLFIEGSPTGHVDFSMKIATLIAVACAPLLAIPAGWRGWIALAFVAVGLLQSAAYVLQFPWYRVSGHGRHESIPAGYHDALAWVREHTRTGAVVFDPASVPVQTVLWPMVIAERRVSLPTRYTESVLITSRPRAEEGVARAEVAVLKSPCEAESPNWRTARRFGEWSVCIPATRLPASP